MNLQALHQWQIENDLLPPQASGNLVSVTPSSGILEHRRVTMPGHLVPKLAGVEGVFAVYDDSSGPEPVGALPGGPNSVKSGQIHGATDAWERGYNGSGVRVAVARAPELRRNFRVVQPRAERVARLGGLVEVRRAPRL